MTLEEAMARLVSAHDRLVALRPAVEAGVPWPRSAQFGVEPEASWMPPELLAHVAEMLPYWLDQIERILDGYPEPVSFGRVQSDDGRIAAIGRDRDLPVAELYERIGRGLDAVTHRLGALDPAAAQKLGTHPTLGEMMVSGVVARMLAGHLEDHVAQLDGILGGAAMGR